MAIHLIFETDEMMISKTNIINMETNLRSPKFYLNRWKISLTVLFIIAGGRQRFSIDNNS